MQSFKDSHGTSWDLRVTVLVARTIKARTGIDIHQLFDERTLRTLAEDVEKTVDLLWCVIERQATERGIDFDTFFTDRADSDTFEVAIDRLLDAVVEYYPEKKRPHAAKVLRILRQTGQEVMNLAMAQIDQLDQAALADLNRSTPGPTSTNSPPSSEDPPSG